MDFAHLHTHSFFSDDGLPSPEALARQAERVGLTALALTDHNTLAGAARFCHACRDRGIRPIIGCELNIASTRAQVQPSPFRIVLLVENEPGYRNLIAAVNRVNAGARKGHSVVELEKLRDATNGLIALTGGSATELNHLLANGKLDETESHIMDLVKVFGRDNVVFEIQDFGSTRDAQIAERIYKLGEFLQLRVVATNDVHYLRPEDVICHRFLKQEPPPGFFNDHSAPSALATRHLATGDQMRKKFDRFPRALFAAADLADRCAFQPNFEKKRFPIHDFVRGFDADSFLWDLTFREARSRFADLSSDMKDRLNQEFDYIRTQRLSNNILLLWNVAQFSHKNKVCMGVGRGNMISSLVAYILGITQINPLDYKLRFLGFWGEEESRERRLCVEIPARHVDALEVALKETFGPDSCSAVGEYDWQQRIPMVREICGWFDLPYEKMEDIIASIESRPADQDSDLAYPANAQNGPTADLVRYMASRLLPRPRALRRAEHQIAISAENLNHLVPRIPAGDKTVTQMDPGALDLLNIPRLFIEPNPTLDVLDAAASWVRKEENAAFDPDRIPLDDDETYDLLDRGLSNGIDPFHSITLKSLLRAHRPRNFMNLVKVKSMERSPGSNSDVDTDVREHVPESLLTYRLAFIKAHYPVCFMTALLTHSYSNRKKFTVILREAKQMGLRMLPPDINHSAYEFSRAHKSIRTGLMVVSGMTEKAYAELDRMRKGGDFNDLLDLCKRTDATLIPNRLLTNLVKAGALDCFGLKRSQMLRAIEEEADEVRRSENSNQVFDISRIPELSQQEIIKHEIAATGYCISVDQLHLYRDLIKQCRALLPYELAHRCVGKEVHVAGFLEHVEYDSPLVDDSDQVLLDLEGRVVTMPRKASRLYDQALNANAPVLIGGTAHRRKDEIYVKALTVFTLRMVQEMSEQVEMLELDLEGEDARTVKLIRDLVVHYRGQGTRIEIKNAAGGLSGWHLGKVRKTAVFFSPPFYYALKKILPEDRITIIASEAMDKNLLHTLSPQRFPRVDERPHVVDETEENSSVVDAY